MKATLSILLILLTISLLAMAVFRSGGDVPVSLSVDTEVDATTPEIPIDPAVNASSLKLPLVNPKIVVMKKKRRLYLYSGGRVVRTYRIGLGSAPRGDKVKEGDRRTPEGVFHICQKNTLSSYHLSLGLDYPNAEDARRGLRSRLITRDQYDRIMAAIADGSCPDWTTPLGGEVFIHGHGSGSDWTWGCVALDNRDVEELFKAVSKGTVVIIRP